MSGLVTQASTPLFDRSESNERRAIVHIGTEKTGSTSVQNLLYKNTKVLKKAGFLFPSASCGLISNFRLLIQTRSAPDLALMRLDKRHPVSADTLAQWRVKFEKRHRKEVESFQSQRSTSTVIYSSEHFHSRLTDPGDLQALLQFLEIVGLKCLGERTSRRGYLTVPVWSVAMLCATLPSGQGSQTLWISINWCANVPILSCPTLRSRYCVPLTDSIPQMSAWV